MLRFMYSLYFCYVVRAENLSLIELIHTIELNKWVKDILHLLIPYLKTGKDIHLNPTLSTI